jgi:hypothetical protein
MAIPDRTADLGSPSASFSRGLRITNIQWQLLWPGSDESLLEFLSESKMEIRFNALAVSKPSNITDPYNADDDGDYTKLLGSVCTQSVTKAISEGDVQQTIFIGCENTIGINGFSAGGSKSCSPPYHQHQANL